MLQFVVVVGLVTRKDIIMSSKFLKISQLLSSKKIFLSLSVPLFMQSSAYAAGALCSDIFATNSSQVLNHAFGDLTSNRRLYPAGVNARTQQNHHIMFGFESEYTLKESEKLLTYYGPKPNAGISNEAWQAKTFEQKIEFVRQLVANRERGDKSDLLVRIKSLKDAAGEEFLPDGLIFDDTGNFEIVLKPMNDMGTLVNRASLINDTIGTGSMQAMVSSPKETFFDAARPREQVVKENIGFFNFVNDFDVLQRMYQGAVKYQLDKTKEVLRPFAHPYLGPMNTKKQAAMSRFMEKNSNGENFDKQRLNMVAWREDSFKYIGSTAYRPDIGGASRVSAEIRDAHKDFNLLLEHTLRTAFYLSNGRSQFDKFQSLKAFDSEADFAKFSLRAQSVLSKLFPATTPRENANDPAVVLAHEVFRNYGFPLRDWSAHLTMMNRADLATTVTRAQESYKNKIEQISTKFDAHQLTKEQARIEAQAAAAEFATESRIYRALEDWNVSNVTANESWNKYWKAITEGDGKFIDSFKASLWRGSLHDRTNQLIAKWPHNIAMVDNVMVELSVPEKHTNWSRARKVLAISFHGLNENQVAEIQSDYVHAMGLGTVSFPLGEDAGHLYTRFGTKVADFYSWGLTINEYRKASYGDRLEPVFELSPAEELNMRTYYSNAIANRDTVLGNVEYGGTQNTNRQLNDNRACAGGHNCTSWMATAPVGKNGELLLELAGVDISTEIGTNPGWWSGFLASRVTAQRVPFVVFQTGTKTLEQVLATQVVSGQKLEWKFGAH